MIKGVIYTGGTVLGAPLLKDERIEQTGKGKQVVNPDPHKIYSRRKER